MPAQVIQAILKDRADETEVALLYANQSPDDILLHAELQQMAAHPRFRVWYTGEAAHLLAHHRPCMGATAACPPS